MVMFSGKGTTGQAWHQDCPPDDATVFNLNRLVYTSDISDEIGGQTVVVPGSFRQGILPAGDPLGEFGNQVVLRPKKGTLILLHGHTWHRVLPIQGAYRSSTNYRAAPAGTPDDVTDVCVYRNMRYRFSTSEVVEERVEA
jgi:ectoine hydroxylase-related dioxygenase (phytanoyl-CoA dioxygenase family)